MNNHPRNPLRALAALAFLLPLPSRAQTEYGVGKLAQYMQSGPSTVTANPGAPFQFNAYSTAPGSFTLPNGQIDQLDYIAGDDAYEILQNFNTQAAMDQAFPSGTYSFSAFAQTQARLPLTGDLYPPPPQIINGTWNANGQLVVDPSSSYSISFNAFPGYGTQGMAGQVLFSVDASVGPSGLDDSWISLDSPVAPTGAIIPAGTLVAGQTYVAELTYAMDTLVDATSVPGAILLSTYAGMTNFTIYAQSQQAGAPAATRQPSSQTVASGSTVVFSFSASGSPQPSYQWYLNGAPIPNAVQPTLVITGATAASAGNYYCMAGNASGSVRSGTASLSVVTTADIGRLINISCRAQVGTGGNILITGFAVGGPGTSGNEHVLIRGSGPALVPFGVAGTIADPQLELHSASGVLGTNNGWSGSAAIASSAASVGAFAWTSASSHDSALLETLSTGPYTAQIAGQNGDTGVALAEVYDATPAGSFTPASPRLVNISARVQVGTGGSILIAGFVIGGSTSRTVLIRASGPALAPFGVAGTLADPTLQLYAGPTLLSSNNGWGGSPQIASAAASVGAFAWSNASSHDSAILVSLPPGAYTAQVVGAGGDTGVALVEVYEVP